MKKRKFKFEKLVRDRIVEHIKKNGAKPHFRKLGDTEYIEELKKKVLEEAKEIPTVKDNNELVSEIADLQEVLDYLIKTLGVSKKELRRLQKVKNKKAGSFKKRHYIDYVETKKSGEWVDYYLARPKKYPEIT